MQKNIFNRYLDVHKDILAYVNELDIFEYVFGFRPREFEDYIASPFRDDSSPGCWFSTTLDGKLKFIDWGSQRLIKGKGLKENIKLKELFDIKQKYSIVSGKHFIF